MSGEFSVLWSEGTRWALGCGLVVMALALRIQTGDSVARLAAGWRERGGADASM